MKYKDAVKTILCNPKRIFKDPPNWFYVKHNFANGAIWVFRAIGNVIQYPFWVIVRIAFYLTAPASALIFMWLLRMAEKEVKKDRERKDQYKNYRKLDEEK